MKTMIATPAALIAIFLLLVPSAYARTKITRKKVDSADKQQNRRNVKSAKSYSCTELDTKVREQLNKVYDLVEEAGMAGIDSSTGQVIKKNNIDINSNGPSDGDEYQYFYSCGSMDVW